MAARASRLLSALTAGGVLAGTLLLGSGAAQAAPQPPGGGTVPATCGQTVTAYPGDRVKVTPRLGVPFVQTVTPGMGPVAMTVSGLLCSVQVKVLVPVSQQLTRVAPPLGAVTESVTEEAGEALTPSSQERRAPALVPAPQAAGPLAAAPATPGRAPVSSLPSQAPMSTLSPSQLSAAAPAFAPAFASELPSSFMSSASPAAAPMDASALFGSAFPGLRAGAPTFLGYDPASAVTTASQVQALPVEGLSDGVGLPAVLAVLALSGAAAFAVRRMVLGKSLVPAGLGAGAGAGAAPLSAAPAAEAPAEQTSVVAPAEAPAERTALVAPPESAAEQTSVVVPPETPAEQTSVVVPPESPAEQTSVVGPLGDLEPAEATAVTPVVEPDAPAADVPAGDVPAADVTGVIEPAGDEAASETTGVLAAGAAR